MDPEYIRSERFIHDELQRRCENVVRLVPDTWRTDRRIYPTLLLWPQDSVQTSTGGEFSGVLFTELPDEPVARKEAVKAAASNCSAYALLLTEQLDDAVRLIFETVNGTRTWRFPIQRRGDTQVLGRPVFEDNVESIGLRWSATQASPNGDSSYRLPA